MSWFSKNKNPADSANEYLDQIPDALKPYFQPYIDRGQESGDKLHNQYGQMTDNPGEFYSNLGKGYKQSPGYEATLREALSGANNAAALGGGGGLGSYGHEELAAGAAGDVANKDFEQYINHIMAMFGEGQKGLQHEEDQGYDSSTRYGEDIGNVLGQKAQYGYAGQAGKNANQSNNWSNLFGALGTIGGGIAGGPLGAAAGDAVSNYFFPKK